MAGGWRVWRWKKTEWGSKNWRDISSFDNKNREWSNEVTKRENKKSKTNSRRGMFGFNTQGTQGRVRYKGERLNLRRREKGEEGGKGKSRWENGRFSQGVGCSFLLYKWRSQLSAWRFLTWSLSLMLKLWTVSWVGWGTRGLGRGSFECALENPKQLVYAVRSGKCHPH